MTIGTKPICVACKHLRREMEGFTCDAFPDGVPMEIVLGQKDHRQPIDGDGGIQFEVVDGAEGRLQKILGFLGWDATGG